MQDTRHHRQPFPPPPPGRSAALLAGTALATSPHAQTSFPAPSGDDAEILLVVHGVAATPAGGIHASSYDTAGMFPRPSDIS